MKKKYRAIIIFIIMVLIIVLTTNIAIATTLDDLNAPASNNFNTAGNKILSIITAIGIVISVVVLAILGLKYMLGSLEERAEYKKSLMPYFIGAILLFGASTVAQIIYNFVK